MKIKLGSFITEARGKLGGTYIQHTSQGVTISRKRNSGGKKLKQNSNLARVLMTEINGWRTLSQANKNTWIGLYGSQLKGYKQYVRQQIFRNLAGTFVPATVNTTEPNSPVYVTAITYTPATTNLTITLATDGTTVSRRLIQIRNYSTSNSRKVYTGWKSLFSYSGQTATPQNLSNPIKALGWKVTDNTSFQLRVIQCNNNRHEITIMPTYLVQTG